MKRLLSSLTLLAFATFLLVVSAATASPVVDPPDASPVLTATTSQPLTDGWYSAALQQTRIDAAKKHAHAAPVYRSAAPSGDHGPVLP